MWVKNSREKDISFFRTLHDNYNDTFKQLDTHLEAAFKASVLSSNLDHKFLALHTLYQSSKSNLLPQLFYTSIQQPAHSLISSLDPKVSPTRYASPMDTLRLFTSFLRCEDFATLKGNNPLKRYLIHNRFLKDFYRMSALELSSFLLYGQLSMND